LFIENEHTYLENMNVFNILKRTTKKKWNTNEMLPGAIAAMQFCGSSVYVEQQQ
jgi:hypothetical protein